VVAGSADIGLIGLGIMGRNLALNMRDHGYTVAVYNRTAARTDEFLAGPAAGAGILPTYSLAELAGRLARPRRVLLMVQAGRPVDDTIAGLLPVLDPGDVIVDGGNSHFADTVRRVHEVEAPGLYYVGAGISGGEEGARHGPSIMPGGSAAAWPLLRPVLQAIAARLADGTPCCTWVGADGAGHFVKMVHNGIEYGDMQLIAEAYDLMRRGLGLPPERMQEVFAAWDRGRLDSYLIEITADIVNFRSGAGAPVLERILDSAGQKGTGRWTAEAALALGTPASLASEAVLARFLSALVDERRRASEALAGPAPTVEGPPDDVLADLEQALYASKLVSYAQGFMWLRQAAAEHAWDLDYAGIALLWRAGCIIRAAFLDQVRRAFREDPGLPSLLLDPYFAGQLADAQGGWRRTVARAAAAGLPVPAYAAALAFYDGYRSGRLPANLIQAQRDYFGAHRYEEVDRPRGEYSHTDWTVGGGPADDDGDRT
jgi:6-phosphogluconate dehydrogenase